MKIALIEPYYAMSNTGKYQHESEPAHLVGMYNLLTQSGLEAEIVDAYSQRIAEHELAHFILECGFTHAAFTCYSYDKSLEYLARVASLLRGKVTVILGGTGPTYATGWVQKAIKPDFMIVGAGERTLQELALCDFDLDGLPEHVSLSASNGCPVLSAPAMALSDIPFARPYSFDGYSHVASPRIQRGCAGACIFCSGAYMNDIEYVSPAAAQEVIHYLVSDRNAFHIYPVGPDFTAIPRQANIIIKAILDAATPIQRFHLSVRLDTLYAAVTEAPDAWKDLGRKTAVSFESSIESFSSPRLDRLGKNVTPTFISDVFSWLEKIIDITGCTMAISRIALDPLVTMDDFLLDNRSFIRLLELFPENVTIAGQAINRYIGLWGTPAVNQGGPGDNPWADSNVFLDSAVGFLDRTLLQNEQFRMWSKLAEQSADFRKRNALMGEILRTACEVGAKL